MCEDVVDRKYSNVQLSNRKKRFIYREGEERSTARSVLRDVSFGAADVGNTARVVFYSH